MKHRIRFAHSLFTVTVLFVLSASADSQQKASASHVRAQHAAVIEKWLESSPRRANLRVAIDKDCRNKSGLAYQRREDRSYQPYYAVGDFNHDGREDFAIAFVNDRKQKSKFSFAIFNGPFGTNAVPAYVEENVDLGTWTFFWKNGGGRDSYLLQGAFESDDCVIYKPRGKSYVPKACVD